MYWKIDQRLPIDGPQDASGFRPKPSMPSETAAFAGVLASHMDTGAHAATPVNATLSPEFVQWLSAMAHRPAETTPATTAQWLAGAKAAPAASPAAPHVAEARPDPAGQRAPAPISRLIHQAATRYHLDPALISSVIAQESSFDPQAVSPAGAQGLMQLMPDTARELKVANSFDPAQNIDGGCRYLAGLIQRYHGNVKLALAAYNWGMGNLERQPHQLPSETRHYVASIMHHWQAGGAALS